MRSIRPFVLYAKTSWHNKIAAKLSHRTPLAYPETSLDFMFSPGINLRPFLSKNNHSRAHSATNPFLPDRIQGQTLDNGNSKGYDGISICIDQMEPEALIVGTEHLRTLQDEEIASLQPIKTE